MHALTTPIQRLSAQSFRIPIEPPESDGTLQWDHTSVLVVEATAAGRTGIGYSYTHPAAVDLVRSPLRHCVEGRPAGDIPRAWSAMVATVRNLGRPGLASTAISAVDTALWDLKARLLDVSLCELLGTARDGVPLYGSGGFTSYSLDELTNQLGDWAAAGFRRVKMKVGRHPEHDVERVAHARVAIGDSVELFVDANGAYGRKQALGMADLFADYGVTWFEEPVSSDDLEGLRLIRDRAPVRMEIAAGEYGFDLYYFRRMLAAGAVDVLQADATRCGGITGFLAAGQLARSHGLRLSCHCAPALHCHPAASLVNLAHLEYFHDHVKVERLLFDGGPEPEDGELVPDRSRPGLGLELKAIDARRFAA